MDGSEGGGGRGAEKAGGGATHPLLACFGPVVDSEWQSDAYNARIILRRVLAKQELNRAPGSVEQGLRVVVCDAFSPISPNLLATLKDLVRLVEKDSLQEGVRTRA